MPAAPRDSQLDVIPFVPPPPGGADDRGALPPVVTQSASRGDRPPEVSRPSTPPKSGESSTLASPAADTGADDIWLEGETLLCRCPDCRAPMSIRLWLLIADCWQCGTSIELSEEQEREIAKLLARSAAPAPAPAPVQAAPPRPAPAATPVEESPPAQRAPTPPATPRPRREPQPAAPAAASSTAWRASPAPPRELEAPRPAAAAPRPTTPREATPSQAASATSRPAAPAQVEQNWLRDWLRQTPAWLISLVIHLFMLIALALWEIPEEDQPLTILLSTSVSRDPTEGEFQTPQNSKGDPDFELPLPDNVDLKDKRVREALLAADQEARQLQLDADAPAPQMADLRRVRELASSEDPVRRSLAVRDPRLRVEVVKKEGGTTLTEAAVARALRWLSKQQRPDGSWAERGPGWENAETSLALLPFLGAGQTHFTGIYKDHVAKGLRFLIRRQRDNGDLRGVESQHPGMYAHGIAAIVLCDAFAMSGDEALRAPAQKSIDFIVAAQSREGGWRYFPRQDSDLSVVGWQLMALQSARMSGLTVPDATLESASQYLDRVGHEGGAVYSYQHTGGEGRPTPAMTAEGLLCRMYLGWRKDEPALVKGIGVLQASHLPTRQERNIYYWYYGTQVFHHFGGEPWEAWNRRMRDLLVESQVVSGANAGSWNPDGDRWGTAGGRIFITSLSACSLEVYYRHAPIYRQLDLDGK